MLHSRKENFSYALHKPHEQKELQGITHHYILYSNHLFIPLLTPLIDPNWINSELAIALVKFF